MCGIFGCIKNNSDINISKLTLNALNLLKNRGYDSCGIFLSNNKQEKYLIKIGVDGDLIKLNSQKEEKSDIFEMLESNINQITNTSYNIGIGHTRWATHGGKTDFNSHPHSSIDDSIYLVHNGIISNYNELKSKYLSNYQFKSVTDTEVIVNMIHYLKAQNPTLNMCSILEKLTTMLEGTWACIIIDTNIPDKIFFMKNENPLLIAYGDNITLFTSEPSGFMNLADNYILLRDKTYGSINIDGSSEIFGAYKELPLIKSLSADIKLPPQYSTWMRKEIDDQIELSVLTNPITNILRYESSNIELNLKIISKCKYLYIIACGSSYYAGQIAANYFRFSKAFEFVNVFDGGEFSKAHLESISNPVEDLLIILISQSGETRDLNIATTICREYIPKNNLPNFGSEIKIIGIINVVGSLISRRTVDNIYTNCGRENGVASTKSCTSQIITLLLLAIYKSELNNKLNPTLKLKFTNDLDKLSADIKLTIDLETNIKLLANIVISKNKSSMFLLGKDELQGVALEGALKIKEISYIHAEGFGIAALKHGPYALIEESTPIIIIYKERDHFVKSIIEEIKTRGAYVIELSSNAPVNDSNIKLPDNKTFIGLLAVVALQLLSYHLSLGKNVNPDRPRNLAKVVTVD